MAPSLTMPKPIGHIPGTHPTTISITGCAIQPAVVNALLEEVPGQLDSIQAWLMLGEALILSTVSLATQTAAQLGTTSGNWIMEDLWVTPRRGAYRLPTVQRALIVQVSFPGFGKSLDTLLRAQTLLSQFAT